MSAAPASQRQRTPPKLSVVQWRICGGRGGVPKGLVPVLRGGRTRRLPKVFRSEGAM